MHPKDLAAKYEVKVFDSPSAAETAGYTLGQSMRPRNVWNRDSAASAILFDLIGKRKRGELSEVALVLETGTVTGAFKKAEAEAPAESSASSESSASPESSAPSASEAGA